MHQTNLVKRAPGISNSRIAATASRAPTRDAVGKLLEIVEGTSYGARASPSTAEQVKRLVDELAAAAPPSAEPTAAGLDGFWRLVYTTERSVHAIVRVLPVAFIGQRVDVSSGRVTNMVDAFASRHAPGAPKDRDVIGFSLRAGAPLKVTGHNKMEYFFDFAELFLPFRLPGGRRAVLPLPAPRVGGWSGAVHADGAVRVMRNSLGDTLVYVRQPPRQQQ